MWILPTFRDKWIVQRRVHWNRQRVLAYQRQCFQKLMRHLWTNSPFYHSYYSDHGIREEDLDQISVRDLPIVTKEVLMENFDSISNDPRLRRAPLEAWIHADDELLYDKRFVVLHTSGTSGALGIFVYDQAAWTRMRAVTARVGTIRINPINRVRLAWFGATHGRFAGVTSCRLLPPQFCDMRLCSVLDPIQKTIDTLNKFQPEQLFGYASAVHELAGAALAGRLRIQPKFVTTSGDVLTAAAIEAIKKAWGVTPTNVYGTSESLCVGLQLGGRNNLTLMEDETLVEMLDDSNQDVAPGELGRVVITSLYNRAIPIVRYDMRDYVTRGHREESDAFDNILRVEGRVNDALPIILDDGSEDTVNAIALSEFFVPGIQKFQFVSETTGSVKLKYVANANMDSAVGGAFMEILKMKGALSATRVAVERKDSLPGDQDTGKHRLVVLANRRELDQKVKLTNRQFF